MAGLSIFRRWNEQESGPVDLLFGSWETTVSICDPHIISNSEGGRGSTTARKDFNVAPRLRLVGAWACLNSLVSIPNTSFGSEVVPDSVLTTIGFG